MKKSSLTTKYRTNLAKDDIERARRAYVTVKNLENNTASENALSQVIRGTRSGRWRSRFRRWTFLLRNRHQLTHWNSNNRMDYSQFTKRERRNSWRTRWRWGVANRRVFLRGREREVLGKKKKEERRMIIPSGRKLWSERGKCPRGPHHYTSASIYCF